MNLASKAEYPSCGAEAVGGLAGCDEVFSRLIGREFADPVLFRAHRLTVDAYCLQHTEKYMISSKSAAAHLMGICWSLEVGESLHLPPELKRFVDGPHVFVRVAVPPQLRRGKINITHLNSLSEPREYLVASREWAQSVWLAWSSAWEQTRAWVREAQKANYHSHKATPLFGAGNAGTSGKG
ncbi:DUF5946 family protein [Woeseia oceani]|uniref:Uncharacterized protein n=1 Tax=Woeseia oceani TaxID=1548547 RepID=A0A193LIM0_9GAMM|nr:DUF5946 family protein [Woeseia oceani]ANO52321.1 hypothetical protein BA177_15015 [Woeseia oceani]